MVAGGRALLTGDAHVLYILETIPQVADKRVINMLEHAAFSNDISHAFGPDDCMLSTMSATTPVADFAGSRFVMRTFIFADILQSKRQIGVFSFDNAYFAKGSSADDSQKSKMVEVHCCGKMALVKTSRRYDGAQARGPSRWRSRG